MIASGAGAARLAVPNSFGLEVQAEAVIEACSGEQLTQLRRDLRGQPSLLLGDGSNLLFVGPYAGTVVLNRLAGIEVLQAHGDELIVQAAAGVGWDELVQWSCAHELWGIENLALIPGRVGAAPVQNIGAYGVELADSLSEVEVIDADGQRRWLAAADCALGYRDSRFKRTPGAFWITALRLRLSRRPRPRLDYAGLAGELGTLDPARLSATAVADAVRRIRRRKLPDPALLGNAGSFFKNPLLPASQAQALLAQWPTLPHWPGAASQIKLSAAWLIEQAGWKGHREADAGVAASHALVLVNHGRATGAQLWALAQRIMADVQRRYGVLLEPEPGIIGK